MMYYSPHTLYFLPKVEFGKDDYGRPVVSPGQHDPVMVCACRCDESASVEITDQNGRTVHPDWHIVCSMTEGLGKLNPGDTVRVMEGEREIAEGNIQKIKRLNYLPYGEIWM